MRYPDVGAALAVAGVAAAAIGLVGVDAGLVWIVVGVWTTRSIVGSDLGLAWGLACLGVGLRWGTTSLADVTVATRLNGATLASGGIAVRVASAIAIATALADEARVGGLVAEGIVERSAAVVSLTALVALFAVRGPGDPATLLPLRWAVSAVVGALLVMVVRRPAGRLPWWLAPSVAVVAVAMTAVAS